MILTHVTPEQLVQLIGGELSEKDGNTVWTAPSIPISNDWQISTNSETGITLTSTDSLNDRYKKAVESESTCDICSYPMELIKGEKRKKYGKINDYYNCPSCGNLFRRRTQNEILRDLGERE